MLLSKIKFHVFLEGVYNHPPYRGQKEMINYSYTIDSLENSRQKILYELGLNFEEINFIINLRQREELLGLCV